MLDSYEIGQELRPEDFCLPTYMPAAKWDHAVVEEISEEMVRLRYVGHEPGTEETADWTRAEMEEMLGWGISPDDNVFEIIDERSEPDEVDPNQLTTVARKGALERLSGACEAVCELLPSGEMRRLTIYATAEEADRAFGGAR